MKVQRIQSIEDIRKAYPCSTAQPIPFWADGLPLCRDWFTKNLGTYIEGLHLEEDDGSVIGHLYWAPSNHALAPYHIEEGVAYLYCDWVQESHRHKGGAQSLYQELLKLLASQGYKGILVAATEFNGYLYYRHYLKHGFRIILELEGAKLMYYPLCQESIDVMPLKTNIPLPPAGQLEVLIIGSHFCPVAASAVLSILKVAQVQGPRVVVKEIPAGHASLMEFGVANGIFINGKAKFFGPVDESQVRRTIEEELSTLSSSF